MISKFSFNDYRMFPGKHQLELSPITVFTGPNNSGKSTLIKLLQALVNKSTSLWKSELSFADYVLEENKDDLIDREFGINGIRIKIESDRRYSSLVSFEFDDICIATIDSFGETKADEISPTFIIHFENILKLSIEKYSILSSDKDAREFRKKLELILANGLPDNLFNTSIQLNSHSGKVFKKNYDQANEICVILDYHISPHYDTLLNDSCYSFLASYFRDIITALKNNNSIDNQFKKPFSDVLEFIFNVFILNELRDFQIIKERLYNISAYRGEFIHDAGSQASTIFQMLNENFKGLLKTDQNDNRKSIFEYFNSSEVNFFYKWLREFEIGEKILTDSSKLDTFKIVLKDGSERYPFELGFGNQQLLPLIFSIFVKPSNLILIQEPESHLHPNLQSKLADFFVDSITGRRYLPPQYIVETHSEYLIRKLQYLVAKRQLDPKDVSIYYINKAGKIPFNQQQIQKMEIGSDGSLNPGFGQGFFDEADNLAIELMKFRHQNN